MKLTARTNEVLNRFSKMEGMFRFEAGTKQGMVNFNKTVLIEAELDQEMPRTFGPIRIKDLTSLLATFDSPDVSFKSDRMVVVEGETELVLNSQSLPDFKSTRRFSFPLNGMELSLTKNVVEKIKKLKKTLNRNILEIVGDGDAVYLRTVNSWRGDELDDLVTKIGLTDRVFSLTLRMTDLNLDIDNYKLYLSNERVLKMCSESSKLTYYIALENMDYFDQQVCL